MARFGRERVPAAAAMIGIAAAAALSRPGHSSATGGRRAARRIGILRAMSRIRCVALPTEIARRFRATGLDDRARRCIGASSTGRAFPAAIACGSANRAKPCC
jgi:hypothetical protein